MNYEEARKLFESNLSITDNIIKNYCYRYTIIGDEADECKSYVYEKIIDDDYKKIRGFKGNSSYKTYITVVISRIFIDKARSGGRWKPSRKAIEMGEEAVILEELVYWKKYPFNEAYNILTTNHKVSINRDRAFEIITLLQRKNVKKAKPRIVELVDTESDNRSTSPDESLINREILKKKDNLDNIIRAMRESLSNEERLLLKMKFEDSINISEIARVLKKDRGDIDRKLRAILRRFEDEIRSGNISLDDIKDIFGL